jgi:methylenetetrahydrofolate dehydrogenase (NADP+)/methenyltetrahydrofolate cyclohydrolase
MTVIFDGRAFAVQKETALREKVGRLKKRGRIPKLVSILVGEDPASVLYVNLKKRAVERIGCLLEIVRIPPDTQARELVGEIRSLNKNETVNGIMIQLPLPNGLKASTADIIQEIDPHKDVDGLREDSPFLHPTSKAILEIIEAAKGEGRVCVVGSTGMVGRPLVRELKRRGHEVSECDSSTKNLKDKTSSADILISVTGEKDLIGKEMVKEGGVFIDGGAPYPDINPAARERARFFTPVPGGVGPVTISCLLENLVEAA